MHKKFKKLVLFLLGKELLRSWGLCRCYGISTTCKKLCYWCYCCWFFHLFVKFCHWFCDWSDRRLKQRLPKLNKNLIWSHISWNSKASYTDQHVLFDEFSFLCVHLLRKFSLESFSWLFLRPSTPRTIELWDHKHF